MQTTIDPRIRLQRIANRLFLKAPTSNSSHIKNSKDDMITSDVNENEMKGFDSLPVELQMHIMDQLSLRECVGASNVNKSWHELALCRPSLWRSIVFDDTPPFADFTTDHFGYLERYCQRNYIKNTFVREVRICKAVDKTLLEIFEFIMKHKWNEIEQVTIQSTRLNASLLVFLNTISKTITTLDLKFKTWHNIDTSNNPDIPRPKMLLPDILLSQCPNLATLIYSSTLSEDTWDDDTTSYSYLDTPHQHLVDFAISLRHRTWYGYKLESLLQSLPKLRRLSVRPDKDEDPELIFTAISQSCPNLDCLNIISSMNDSRIRGPIPTCTNTTITTTSVDTTLEGSRLNEQSTLREFVIDDQKNAWYSYAKALSNLDDTYSSCWIKKHCKTIECLDISGYWFLGPMLISNNLARFSFPSLNMLFLSDSQGQPQPSRIASSLCTFLRHTPVLFYADFTGVNALTDQVMQTLKNHNTMETLRLKYCRNVTSSGLSEFIKNNVYLVELRLQNMSGLTDDIFSMLGDRDGLPSLRVLEIVACYHVSLAGLDRFITQLEKGREEEHIDGDSAQEKQKKPLDRFTIDYYKSDRSLNLDWAIELLLGRLDKKVKQWKFIRPSICPTKYDRISELAWIEQEKKKMDTMEEMIESFKNLSLLSAE
ncbi:hypothetical protein BDA99DRAFT_606159 [Phascolomyces articulosus]|uniref:F-box domain-containing protein n=1 Tax=Phascolomyces articulosus TaxID=60185 RepID=A0AAD5PCD6_9FUNG|nr:hypothetical protein BDA99DRAFT_606159 [Phascolomyces articulosus]